MGLVRGMARTAVIAGTATTVSNRVSRRQQGRWAAQDAQAAQAQGYNQQQYAQPAPAPVYVQAAPEAPAGPSPDALEQLQKLGDLKAAGILTQEEFAIQKAKILAQ